MQRLSKLAAFHPFCNSSLLAFIHFHVFLKNHCVNGHFFSEETATNVSFHEFNVLGVLKFELREPVGL